MVRNRGDGVTGDGRAHASGFSKRLIVVGIDGSKASDAAFAWAARETGTRGAVLKVVHVLGPSLAVHGLHPEKPGKLEAQERAFSRTLVARVSSVLGSQPGVEIVHKVQQGRPAHAPLAEASEADLLVVGAGSRHFPKPPGSTSAAWRT